MGLAFAPSTLAALKGGGNGGASPLGTATSKAEASVKSDINLTTGSFGLGSNRDTIIVVGLIAAVLLATIKRG